MQVHRIESPEEGREPASDRLPAEIMTAAEVARYLHCSKAHVYNAINGKIENVPPCRRSCLAGGGSSAVRRSNRGSLPMKPASPVV